MLNSEKPTRRTGKYALVERDGYLVTEYVFDELDRRSDTTFFAKKGELVRPRQ